MFLLILINKTLTKITKNVKINKHNIQYNSQLFFFFLANNKFDSIFMLFTLSTCQCYALLAHLLQCKKKKINTFLLPFHKTAFCCVYLGFLNSPNLAAVSYTFLFFFFLLLWHISCCCCSSSSSSSHLPSTHMLNSFLLSLLQPQLHQDKKKCCFFIKPS